MTSHNAPSVTYPLGHSRSQGYFLLCLWLTGSVLTLFWIYKSQAFDWRVLLALTTVMLVGAIAYKGWKNAPAGQLVWDGQCWHWEGAGYLAGATEQELTVLVDFQSLLLLRLRNPAHAHLWLWAERRVLPERWLDLRRAVYSPQKTLKHAVDNKIQAKHHINAAATPSHNLPADISAKS